MFSYHKFNERSRVDKILDKLKNGEDVAIISDAGTPGRGGAARRAESTGWPPGHIPLAPACGAGCFRIAFFYVLIEANQPERA